MLSKSGSLLALCLVLVAGAQEQAKRQLTARELFYSAVQSPPKSDAAQPPAQVAPAQAKASPPAAQKAARTEVAAAPKPAPAVKSTPAPPQPHPDSSDGARVVQAVATAAPPSAGMPLGLKYSILKKSGDNMVEVPTTSTFHAGDRIQISVQTNQSGYLYIISQGSSGTWKPMFPSAEVEDGSNHIEGFRSYIMPPKSRILFDEQAGNEKLFVVFSREPEPDLEKMIYSLQGGGAAPKKDDSSKGKPTLLVMANSKIDNGTVGRLRNSYSRDLVIEKVDENTPGARKEDAVYVVNPTGSADSRVVADLQLVHQ